MPDKVKIEKKGEILSVIFPKHVILSNLGEIRQTVKTLLFTKDYSVLIADFSNSNFIDSSGIGFLFSLGKQNKKAGKEVYIICKNNKLLSLFKLACLDRLYPVISSIENIITKKEKI